MHVEQREASFSSATASFYTNADSTDSIAANIVENPMFVVTSKNSINEDHKFIFCPLNIEEQKL